MSLIENLPNEVLLDIFKLLNIKDLYCCASVSQRFGQNQFWNFMEISFCDISFCIKDDSWIHTIF